MVVIALVFVKIVQQSLLAEKSVEIDLNMIRQTYVESKFRPYTPSSATGWCPSLIKTQKSASMGSITSMTGLEITFLFIEIFSKIFISRGPDLQNWESDKLE